MDDPVFVDTNVFLRFFVKDVESQYEQARALFEKSDKGQIKLETSELVIAEIVWVLDSFYGFSRKEITGVLSILLSSKNLKIANHARMNIAVDLYSEGTLDFIDAYNIAYMQSKKYSRVATFDLKHYKKAVGITII
ncbi:MAG: type II toxin-antitoxin system VapC family toxin [Nitrospirae bacterium]|nr:type II toxin-antitoxin system VapC family toxin [Nitrospirota bacterium]